MPTGRKLSLNVQQVHTTEPTEIPAADLHGRLGKDVTVIDVRPAEEFAQTHIPGSVNMPVQEIRYEQLADAQREKEQSGQTTHAVVFVSAQSPDLDDLAAREYINAYTKVAGHEPAPGTACVLLGGLYTWNSLYADAKGAGFLVTSVSLKSLMFGVAEAET